MTAPRAGSASKSRTPSNRQRTAVSPAQPRWVVLQQHPDGALFGRHSSRVLATPLGPRMAVPADAVEVVRALHQDAATVQVGHGSERRHCNATPSALVRERRAPPRRTEHGLARAPPVAMFGPLVASATVALDVVAALHRALRVRTRRPTGARSS